MLASELTHRTPLVIALETVRERRSLELSAWIAARFSPPAGIDLDAIAMLIGVAINYLAVRAKEIRVMSGVAIHTDADWERIFAAVDGIVDAVMRRRRIFLARMSPSGDKYGGEDASCSPLAIRALFALGGAALAAGFAGGVLLPPRRSPAATTPTRRGGAGTTRRSKNTPLALVAAGALAANPHDTQPWLFHVRSDAIEVYADLTRNLGAMDAYLREMHLGLGCAIENMMTAAAANGFEAELEVEPGPLPTGLRGSLRRPCICAGATPPPRRATRQSQNATPIATPTIRRAYCPRISRSSPKRPGTDERVRVKLFDDGPQRLAFDAAVVEATEAIIADKTMIGDSDRWFRASSKEIDQHRDGPTLDAAGLSPLTLMFAKIFPVSTETSRQAWLSQTRDVQLASAPTVGMIFVADRYDRAGAIAAGRIWQRLHLEATLRGLAMQPLNQPIELIDRERQLGRPPEWEQRIAELTDGEGQATFAFRVGYARKVAPPSPRRRLEDILIA